MEEVGAQVAHPIYVHQPLAGRYREPPTMAKKRDLPWQNSNFLNQQQQQQWYQGPNGNWDPKVYEWDSVRFVAKVSEAENSRGLGTTLPGIVETAQKKKGDSGIKPMVVEKSVDEEAENLTLQLGGSLYSGEEPTTRPNKRVRSGSPGTASYPVCQVDDCKGDLTSAKDYHRRHKVCEIHSKTTKALVGKQMQRFCQQCSRFHPLSEFDEGKRSCRRRLAGHNRRRRKTQPEEVSARLPGTVESNGNGNLDIVNLLTLLASIQGNNGGKIANGTSIPDKDRLIQILNKISLPATTNSSSRVPVTGGFDLNVSQQAPSEHPSKSNVNASAPSTMDLLTVLQAAVGASSPDTLANLSQSSHSSNVDKIKMNCLDQPPGCGFQKKPVSGFQSVGGERSCTTFHSPIEIFDSRGQESQPSLPLQLFTSSPEDDSPAKLDSSRKYFSSDSSNPMEERSPSSSPPVVHKLFPLRNGSEIMKHESLSTSGEDNGTAEASTTRGWNSPMEFFKESSGQARNSLVQNLPYHVGYASSSGSDHSPSTSNSDAQDRTGRILFKLFDKDPSSFPGTLRTEILHWLSQSPSEMESYIRPGCVVLSIYISMPSAAWKQLHKGLLQRVNSLVHDSHSDIWRSGRFLVQTDGQLASHKDGKIRLCKSWKTWSSPELISVTPLAVVGGQNSSLVLRGRNLNVPGTKIHCTYAGGYLSKEVEGSAGTVYDDASSESFSFSSGAPCALGRCFIEVENGFKGNSFPLIIADASICQELRLLESEFEEETRVSDVNSDDTSQDLARPRSREDVVYFLNELGWLFQRKTDSIRSDLPDFSLMRFKFLFAFSIERDWYALVKRLLDIFVERNLVKEGLSKDSLDMLSEVHLLNRAVKRKCVGMINLLIHYSISSSSDASKKYVFLPNQAGPGGITPLHLAASTHDSEAVVDALTNDPQQIGLKCWHSLPDASGQSPYDYALARRNHFYNRLVDQKVTDRKQGQVSILVGNEALDQSWISRQVARKISRSCIRCSTAMTRNHGPQVYPGMLRQPYMRPLLAIAAVCVCVALLLRGAPDIGSIAPFKWENLGVGTI
ncbi:hypothetical protein IFM89_031809 [Coptis chinensis]|uniref:SBP-type domain-containing protein n=1 Tax=Coptis chinensis TaxID=261450 RepID=A0A835HTC5_9MAGN|nr:hypothetical protein IFM89_031809 [Coptis chinensis]